MDTTFMNSYISEISHPQRTQAFSKINLKRNDEYVALSNIAFTIHRKIQTSYTKIINLKYQL